MMIYYHICDGCTEEIKIPVVVAHNTIAEINVPQECPNCGLGLVKEKIEDDIYIYVYDIVNKGG